MAEWRFLLDILILLSAAVLLGTVAEMLRQSAIVGYLVAGTLVGPNVIGLVEAGDEVHLIAELGVALLLFTIGLEFSFPRLRRMGRVALVGGSLQVVLTMLAAAVVAVALGLGMRGSVSIGAIVALSSTACVLRLLVDRAAVDSIHGRNALGILLLQDAAVVPLVLLMAMVTTGSSLSDAGETLLRTAIMAAALIGVYYGLLQFGLLRLLRFRTLSRNREFPILLAMVVALGSALGAHWASISPAIGAFIAGVLLGGSPFAVQIRADVSTLRTVLVTLFFASIGMLGEPMWMLQNWYLVLGVVAAILVGKTAITWMVMRWMGFANGLALATGICVAQIGEFSFVLAEAAQGKSIDEPTFRLIVSATIVTLFLTPFMVNAAPRIASWLQARRSASGPALTDAIEGADEGAPQRDIFIIGFGPSGERVAQALFDEHRQRVLVLDMNVRNIATAQEYEMGAQLGDACQRDVLEHAGVARARVVVITVPDPTASRIAIQHCKALAPMAVIIARARYHVLRWELQLAGALEVVDEEAQIGMTLADVVRRHLVEE
ncbi:MAG: sodium:proton exchanger [Phycisphaeraceae bacterium]|nr:sodium:proton exchanger [Phycisphaeraceae bacterium]